MPRSWANERERREDHYTNRLNNLWDRVIAQHGDEMREILANGGSAQDIFDSVLNGSVYFSGGMLASPSLRQATWGAITANIDDWDSRLMAGYEPPVQSESSLSTLLGINTEFLDIGNLITQRSRTNFVRLGLFGRSTQDIDLVASPDKAFSSQKTNFGYTIKSRDSQGRETFTYFESPEQLSDEQKKQLKEVYKADNFEIFAITEKREPLIEYYLPDGRVALVTPKQADRFSRREAVSYTFSELYERQRQLREQRLQQSRTIETTQIRTPLAVEVPTGAEVPTTMRVGEARVKTSANVGPRVTIKRTVTSTTRKTTTTIEPSEEEKTVREQIALRKRNAKRQKELKEIEKNEKQSTGNSEQVSSEDSGQFGKREFNF